jgi:hypothetical protein
MVAVNSVHPQTEQPAIQPWLEKAKREFPNAAIVGSGRFALLPLDSPKTIMLFETRDEARGMVVDESRVRITDLQAPTLMETLAKIPDRYPD